VTRVTPTLTCGTIMTSYVDNFFKIKKNVKIRSWHVACIVKKR